MMANAHGITHGQVLRAGGAVLLRNGHRIWSPLAFKKAFKVGDLICGGASITGRITAIGDSRFLYRITRNENASERVGTMRNTTGWGKPGERRL